MKAIVYKLTNKVNGMIYVGATTTQLPQRMSSHICEANRGSKSEIYKAMREFGTSNFEISEVETCEKEELLIREEFYIKRLNSMFPNGYNTSTSHLVGGVQSDISKIKKSESHTKRWEKVDRNEWSIKMKRIFMDKDTKEKHRISTTKANILSSARTCIGTSLKTGETKIFESANDAAKYVKGHHSKVSNVCHGKRKKHKDWTFSYLE